MLSRESSTTRLTVFVLAAFLCAVVSGCATSSHVDMMLAGVEGGPSPVFDSAAHVENVSGGRSSTMWDSVGNVSSADFHAAFKQSLEEANVFTHIGASEQAEYILSANIQRFDKPMMGFDMTVSIIVKYRILDSDRKLVWEEQIGSSHTEGTCSSCSNLVGAVRLNRATQGAVRKNLAAMIEKVIELDL